MKANADRLRLALSESHALAAALDVADFPLARLERLQDWQRARLAATYDDFIAQDRFRPAGEFFLGELYGGLNFRERDQEVERVLPVMVRTMPDHMLEAMAEAFELQGLSLRLDIAVAHCMAEAEWRELDPDRYGAVYRAAGRFEDRERQIDLIRHLGLKLNELVHHRLVIMLLRMLRGPARAAGFGRLQNFLEDGLQAFRDMRDGTEFIMTIWHRERTIADRLQAGDQDPFRPVAL